MSMLRLLLPIHSYELTWYPIFYCYQVVNGQVKSHALIQGQCIYSSQPIQRNRLMLSLRSWCDGVAKFLLCFCLSQTQNFIDDDDNRRINGNSMFWRTCRTAWDILYTSMWFIIFINQKILLLPIIFYFPPLLLPPHVLLFHGSLDFFPFQSIV